MGPLWVFVICGIFYVVVIWVMLLASDYDTKESKKLTLENLVRGVTMIWSEFKEGMIYLRQVKDLMEPIVKLTVGWIIVGVFIILLLVYGEKVLNIKLEYVGFAVIILIGLGLVVLVGVFARKKKMNGLVVMRKGFIYVVIASLIFVFYRFYGYLGIVFGIMFFVVIIIGYGFGMV